MTTPRATTPRATTPRATAPRTVAGQAALSAMRPWVKRALSQTILAIEDEAMAPCLVALQEADRVLERLAARDASSPWDEPSRLDLVRHAEAAHQIVRPLLAERRPEEGA